MSVWERMALVGRYLIGLGVGLAVGSLWHLRAVTDFWLWMFHQAEIASWALLALGILFVLNWLIELDPIQRVINPRGDSLEEVTARHRSNKPLPQSDALLALAFAVSSSRRAATVQICVVAIVVALMVTQWAC